MARPKKKAPMTEKVKIVSNKENQKRGLISMLIGTILVALGLLLFVIGVVSLVLYNLPAKEDLNIKAPIITEFPLNTNKNVVRIQGKSEYGRVMIIVNDEILVKNLKQNGDTFIYEYAIENEGKYEVKVASISGFPIRKRSAYVSNTLNADFTAPKNEIKLSYKKNVDTKNFSVSGTVEPNVWVILSNGSKEYKQMSNEFGKFNIKNVPVKEGGNTFSITLQDIAGNATKLDSKVSVIYVSGNINGNGASTTNLPESAGLFENKSIMEISNALLFGFTLLSVIAFGVNMSIVDKKLKKLSNKS